MFYITIFYFGNEMLLFKKLDNSAKLKKRYTICRSNKDAKSSTEYEGRLLNCSECQENKTLLALETIYKITHEKI